MKYIGLQTQIWRNNTKSILLLIMFPLVFYVLTYVFFFIMSLNSEEQIDPLAGFISAFPWITIGVGTWFMIAFFSHSSMINRATGAKPLERKENKRVYNLVENLCIASGQNMPRINVIEDDSLNAFASGISKRSYTVSLSRGIINKLNDDELEGVIAHELTHIRNRDVRLLIVSIVFVGIFAFVTQALLRTFLYGGRGRRDSKNGGAIAIIMLLAAVGWFLSTLFRFALSRKREYMADAGAAEMTRNPQALAQALKKVSSDSRIEAVTREDVAQMFIENPGEKKKKMSFSSMFTTHPPIADRIRILEAW